MITYHRKRNRSAQSDGSSKAGATPSSDSQQPCKRPRSDGTGSASGRKQMKLEQLCFVLDDDAGGPAGGEGELGFATRTCPKCGMTYTPGTEDERVHEQYHRRETAPVRNRLLLNLGEVVSRHDPSGTVVVRVSKHVLQESSTSVKHSVESILKVMDTALGSPSAPSSSSTSSLSIMDASCSDTQILFLCVHERTGTVHGAAVAEPISKARSIVEDDVVRCAGPFKRASAGIAKIFVYEAQRRRGVATKLLDAVRGSLVYGYVVPIDELAFTQPTRDGKALFAKYTGTKTFLVYDDEEEDDGCAQKPC